jgi:hypothetical protein
VARAYKGQNEWQGELRLSPSKSPRVAGIHWSQNHRVNQRPGIEATENACDRGATATHIEPPPYCHDDNQQLRFPVNKNKINTALRGHRTMLRGRHCKDHVLARLGSTYIEYNSITKHDVYRLCCTSENEHVLKCHLSSRVNDFVFVVRLRPGPLPVSFRVPFPFP